MIPLSRFPVEPWDVREYGLDLNFLAQAESIFALSNGHIGLRGNLDEGDPAGLPGTYLNSYYESRPLPYAEAGYGFPESGQTVVNVTDGKLIRLLVDDEPMDLRYGQIDHHERILDLRAGVLRRVAEWTSPARQTVRVRSTRLVSLSQRSIVAIQYSVEAVRTPARVVLQSELVANEEIPRQSADPRVAAALERPLEAEDQQGQTPDGTRALLMHRTRASRLRMGAAMDHLIDAPDRLSNSLVIHPDWARLMVGTVLQPGERLTLTKFLAYGWSSQRSLPALRDQVEAALSAAVHTGFDELMAEQRAVLDEFWHGADVEVDGAPALQQAARFALFHTFQAAARAEQRAVPAKGLTGPGYDGHAFWDTESFVLPVLTATAPSAAADALRWRASTLDLARERAHTLDLRGAAFPWRTIRGQETSGYWPAGTAAMHVNADVAGAVARHWEWTRDERFDRDVALPILLHTARLWMSLGYHGDDGLFHVDGVTGPDEYSALVDDNTYTNLMAKRNLLAAADCVERWAAKAGVDASEVASWRRAAEVMAVPYDPAKEVYQQDKGFTEHQVWDFEATARDHGYPLLLHYPYMDIYRKQVIKQADLILAMHWCGDEFSFEEKARAFAYYDPLTVRDSSLSACTQAVMAAETGHLDLAFEYLCEAALMDLHDLEHNTRDGLHIASLAGAWIALVAGFGGMRDFDGQLSFRPQLPPQLSRLRFALRWRGVRIGVTVSDESVTYELEDGPDRPVTVLHDGEPVELRADRTVTRPLCRVEPITPRPAQPAGRPPYRPDGDPALRATDDPGGAQGNAVQRGQDDEQGAEDRAGEAAGQPSGERGGRLSHD